MIHSDVNIGEAAKIAQILTIYRKHVRFCRLFALVMKPNILMDSILRKSTTSEKSAKVCKSLQKCANLQTICRQKPCHLYASS